MTDNKRDIFKKRINYKPFEYPEVQQIIDSMNQVFWTHSEINFTADVQDLNVNLNEVEREIFIRSALSIAQVECDIKTFWANLYKHFPKAEFNDLGVTLAESECYDNETKVLTNKGFKLFKDLQPTDLVASYNIATKEIAFQKPLSYITKPYKGKMHHYFSKNFDLMVTPNHEIILENPHTHKISKKKSSDGVWGGNFICPVSGYKRGNKEFTTLDRLLIAIQSDGSLFGTTPSGRESKRLDFCFSLSKDKKINRLKSFLEDLGIKYKESIKSNGQTAINASLKDFVTYDIIEKIKDFSYINLEEIDSQWGQEFIEELKYWDCNVKPNVNYFTYYNSREKAVNKVVEICALSGYRTCKSINRTAKESLKILNPDGSIRNTSKDCYALTISRFNKTTYPYRKEVDYDGYVYCVEVPYGNIVVSRGKRVTISGNCRHAAGYAQLLEVNGLNSRFEKIYDIPVFKRKLELLENSLTNRKDIVEKLLFFTIVIENSSLFSQFANILSFTRFKGLMKNTSNIIQWSSLEEEYHKEAGILLINIIREEQPKYFEDMSKYLIEDVHKYIKYEEELIDWIFEKGEFEFYTKKNLLDFMKYRIDEALIRMGFEKQFNITKEEYKPMSWFDEEIKVQQMSDFFAIRPTDYSKHNQSYSKDNLF